MASASESPMSGTSNSMSGTSVGTGTADGDSGPTSSNDGNDNSDGADNSDTNNDSTSGGESYEGSTTEPGESEGESDEGEEDSGRPTCESGCGPQLVCENEMCVEGRRVFASSTTTSGNIGGLAGADGMCQDLAAAEGLPGTYMAYMVDSSEGLDRLDHPSVPFVRVDGVRVANNWADLSNETLEAPLNVDETGAVVEGNVWTGLINVTGSFNNNCESWTFGNMGCLAGQPCGGAGESGMTDNHWDGFYVFHCSNSYRLYCIEQ